MPLRSEKLIPVELLPNVIRSVVVVPSNVTGTVKKMEFPCGKEIGHRSGIQIERGNVGAAGDREREGIGSGDYAR